MRTNLVKYLLPAIAVGMLAFGGYHVLSSQPSAEKLSPPASPALAVQRLSRRGLVEAKSENIAITPAIPGRRP